MAFGEKLQEVRKQSGMTQETFAEQLHVSRTRKREVMDAVTDYLGGHR